MASSNHALSLLHAILAYASIGVASVRANHTSNERDYIISLFNEDDSDLDVLIINQSLSMTGLNLHHRCHIGIMAQYLWNYWGLIQVWGRIVRMGQSKLVTWYVLVTEGTYSMVMEDKMCRKIVPEIVFAGRISPRIRGSKVRRLIAYEILRFKVGHPFNRFVWAINPPADVTDYTSTKMERMGTLAGWIVSAVLNCAESEDSIQNLCLLDLYLVSLLHQYGDMQGCIEKPFRLDHMAIYINGLARYKPDIRTRPFWSDPRTHKTSSYEGYITMAMDPEDLAARKDRILGEDAVGSQPPPGGDGRTAAEPWDVDEDLEYDEDVDPEHSSGMEDPGQYREMLDTADQFFASHLANERQDDAVEE